jgi:hypothetical protein
MATKKKSKGVNALMKINRRAKQIVAYSGGSYRVAHKKASAEYRADHKPKARKKTVGKIHRKKIGKPSKPREVGKDKFDNKRVSITVGSITTAQAKHLVRANTKEQLAWALLQRDTAKNKTARRKINKKITTLRSTLKGYE